MQILVSVQSPSCKPQPYHLPPRLGPVLDGKLAPGPPISCRPGATPVRERDGWRGKEPARAMCAKVSGGCAHNHQQVSRDLHLGVCLSHCVCVPLRACVGVFSCFKHNHSMISHKGSEPGSLTD